MKNEIVVLAHALTCGGGLSVGYNIIRCLNESTFNVKYTFILPNNTLYNEIDFSKAHEVVWYENKYSVVGRWFFDNIKLPKIIMKINPDWILGLGNLGVPSVDTNQAILFHKPQLIYPAKHSVKEIWHKKLQNNAIRNVIKRSLTNTKIVFCQTETASKRFREYFNYHGLINIWPNAVSSKVKSDGRLEAPRVPKQLERWKKNNNETIDFFVLTRYYPHKNLELIVDACKRYHAELNNVRFILTIDGSQHPLAHKLIDDINSSGLNGSIINVGPVKQEELAAFYYHTDGLLLPTLLESFSGTYLEAMEFQSPIITSRIDFAEELCGEAALYFDPWSTEEFVSTILRFCKDEKLRGDLVKNGESQRLKYNHDWVTTTANAEKSLLEFNTG